MYYNIFIYSSLTILIGIFFIVFTNKKLTKILGLYFSILVFWEIFSSISLKREDFISSWSEEGLYIDGISILLIILTSILIGICILCSWNIKKDIKTYIILFMISEIILFGVFSVTDLIYFYILYEAILIPLFMIIGIWGSRERKILASYQFFIYTLAGSLCMLLGIIYIYIITGTTNLPLLLNYEYLEWYEKCFLWLSFIISFAVKIPMMPFHIWLPEAHVEAPTAGSILLAGILLKLGSYGLFRYSIPLFPDISFYFFPFIFSICSIGILYSSLTTLRQIDMKKIIAYASIGHMNFAILGLFTFNYQGIIGSISVMLSHGLVSSALFLSVGLLYSRFHTRILKFYRGLVQSMPLLGTFFLFFILGNFSFPGTFPFVGEILIFHGLFLSSFSITFLSAIGVLLTAFYSLWFYNRIFFGSVSPFLKFHFDINVREFFLLFPFAFLVLLFGIKPNLLLDMLYVPSSILL